MDAKIVLSILIVKAISDRKWNRGQRGFSFGRVNAFTAETTFPTFETKRARDTLTMNGHFLVGRFSQTRLQILLGHFFPFLAQLRVK